MEITQGSKFRVFDSKEQVQMGLNLESTHTLMSMLRNNIYSDPLTSFVREVFSNAIDANVRAGRQNAGVDIYLEREDSHGLYIVRDYGDSMDKDKIKSVYAVLGKSDKTSDNSEIGGWGIGAASPLAYTDHFFIETWTQEGDQKMYRKWVQYIDTSRIGAIGLQEEHEAYPDDKLGTKVSVPFKLADKERVLSALSMYLFYTNTYYRLHGAELNYKAPRYNQFGRGWGMVMTNEDYNKWDKPKGSAMVLVGDIPYRLNMKVFFDTLSDFPINNVATAKSVKQARFLPLFTGFLASLPYYEWEISVPIGSVDLSAAREDLQYTSRTIFTLVKHLYDMYNEYCDGIIIELTRNTNLHDACKRYTQFYGGFIKHYFLHSLKWEKEDLIFDGRKALLLPRETAEIYSYHLDKVTGQNERDILRKNLTGTCTLGHLKRAVVIKQDTDYRNYGKFLKFYMQREDNKYNLRTIVVKDHDWHKLCAWVTDSFEQRSMSELVEYYRKCNPSMAKAKGKRGSLEQKVEFRCFSFVGRIHRERADGFGCLFTESVAPINPDSELYYISEQEVADAAQKLDFPGNQSDMLNFLKKYLSTKGIKHQDLFYTKKTTRNFNDENWISLIDVMLTDQVIYQRDHVEYMQKSFFHSLCVSQFKFITEYQIKDVTHKRGRTAQLFVTYAKIKQYVRHWQKLGRYNFYALTDSKFRSMMSKANSRYNVYKLDDLFWLHKNDEELSTAINAVAIYILNYFNDYPMLKYINAHYDSHADVHKPDFLQYIDIVEKHRHEDNIEEEEPLETPQPSDSFTVADLLNYFQ